MQQQISSGFYDAQTWFPRTARILHTWFLCFALLSPSQYHVLPMSFSDASVSTIRLNGPVVSSIYALEQRARMRAPTGSSLCVPVGDKQAVRPASGRCRQVNVHGPRHASQVKYVANRHIHTVTSTNCPRSISSHHSHCT